MRMTRAAMRARAEEEDLHHDASEMPQQPTIHEDNKQIVSDDIQGDTTVRPALRDITDENYPKADSNVEVEPEPKSTKKGRAKSRGRKPKKAQPVEEPVQDIHIYEEPEEAPEDPGMEVSTEPESRSTVAPSGEALASLETPQSVTPAKPGELLSKTPKFDPEVHVPECDITTNTRRDSFIDSIKSRSPSKFSLSHTDNSSRRASSQENLEPRFTPLRRVSSSILEDSVDAMDALEDAIEEVTAGLPLVDAENMGSPDSPPRPSRASLMPETPLKHNAISPRRSPARSPLTVAAPTHLSPAKTRSPAKSPARTPAKSVTTLPPSPVKESKPPASVKRTASARKPAPKPTEEPLRKSSTTSTTDTNLAKKRVGSNSLLSTAKPAFVPAKSTRPPTVSTFALPGEAVAAKLKADREAREERMKSAAPSRGAEIQARLKAQREAREERLKKQQEQAKAAPLPAAKPKARPSSVIISSRPSIAPRENKASLARRSMMITGSSSNNKENVAPRPTPTINAPKTRPVSMVASSTTARNASTSSATAKPPVNHARITSLSSGKGLAVTAEDTAKQHAKGKEVFQRARATLAQEQEEKRQKEEAARKARAEAAERGRQASREWAEKMKKKMAEGTKKNGVAAVLV